eukprot:TCONS_00024720-protein
MGASESSLVLEQKVTEYEKCILVNSHSTSQCEDVFRLYNVPRVENEEKTEEHFLEDNLLNNYATEKDCYVFVLVNQSKPEYLLNFARFDGAVKEAEQKFNELVDILFPFVEDYPSVQTPENLKNYLKLNKQNREWDDGRIAQYLNLPNVKTKQNTTKKIPFNRQKSHHQEETIGLVLKEQPSFARDLLGTLPVQFFTEKHPELFESVAAAVDSIHKTGLDLKESIEGITRYTESPIHVAIRLSQESVLKMLLEKGANHLIPCGHAYPAHLALQHESLGCLRILLKHDENCLKLQDKKYSGSLLHWAKNTDQIDVLTAYDMIDLNARNTAKETALHIMIKRQRLSPVISLISHGVNIDAQNKDGDTPLHFSVKEKDLDLTRALLILGADPSLKNKNGQTPLESVDTSSTNYSDLNELFGMFDYEGKAVPGCLAQTEERTQSIYREKTGHLSLLTLDGGGIRGLILTEILLMIEHLAQEPIYNLFDWISGTSTGSYLSTSLCRGRNIRHCQRAYLRLGRSCFTGIRPYSTELMDDFLLKEFGENTRMDSFSYPRLLIPAVMADRRPAMLHFFRNYDAPYDTHYQMRDARFPRPPQCSDQKMWLAVRSSCSAPSYFRSTGRYLDGGLISNNPTLDAMAEINKYHKHQKEENKLKLVFSIGRCV